MKLHRALPRAGAALKAPIQPQPRPITARATSISTARTISSSATTSAGLMRQGRAPAENPGATRCPLPLRQSRHHASSAPDSLSTGPLKKTALYDLHLAHGARMVPFGGYHMPVQYADQSVSASHHFTRSHASLFDVGHMVQHRFSGPGAADFLQRVTPGSIAALQPHHSTLSTLLWPGTGGIVDDTIITRLPTEHPDDQHLFYVVTNAACRDKDLAYLGEELRGWDGAEVRHEVLEGWGLIALQGPLSEETLAKVLVAGSSSEAPPPNLRELYFGQSAFARVRGAERPVLASRGGYTGEDGFEISTAPSDAAAVAEALLAAGGLGGGPEEERGVRLAGLGARDSLRLEAGMCLYGHDLDDGTTPVEAALSWVVGRDRRATADPARGAFHGAEVVLAQLTPRAKGGRGVERRRVGLVVEGAPAREGAEILAAAAADGQGQGEGGERIGVVTSGCPSPTLGKNIAMGYVRDGLHKAGTEVEVLVRGRRRKAVVTKMPFVPTKYWKGPPAA
ncbi:hypothetical protein DL762_007783 [Monosporascus cannonballus]|uniref:aminomethyltransferase n=1 Tax=Monosporascus cannonballus TaxID=155416 RepID=A0ABY0H2D8_9PEZI|nr:hypothetical protein DL762_007783 [Monosporascus cannonballus]